RPPSTTTRLDPLTSRHCRWKCASCAVLSRLPRLLRTRRSRWWRKRPMSRALADLAKHLVEPEWQTTGWPRVRDTCNNLGWHFDEWQDDLGRLILAKDATGLYAASICVMSLPRQVGKTY